MMRLNHTTRCLVGIVLMCSLLVSVAVPAAPAHAASGNAPVRGERPQGPRFTGFATTEEKAIENAYKGMENHEKWHDVTCTPYEERFGEPKGIHFYYTIFAQCTKNDDPGEKECENYEMTGRYRHPFDFGVFGTVELPVSDEIDVRYRACWNNEMVWGDVLDENGDYKGIQFARIGGSELFEFNDESYDDLNRFGNLSDEDTLLSGATLIFRPRLNASYQGIGINGNVTVKVEILVQKGGCARLYANDIHIAQQYC